MGGWVGGLIRSQVREGRGGAEGTRETHEVQFNLYHAVDGACRMQTKSTRQPIDVLSAQRQKCHILHSSFSLTKLSPVIPLILFS